MIFNHQIENIQVEITQNNNLSGTRYYTVAGSSKMYPSITTVLGDGNKEWLTDWRNALGQKKADKETARCAKRGSAVHALTECYLYNQHFDDFTKGIDRQYIKLFNQIKPFLNRINNIHAIETRLYSPSILEVAGTVDCIAEYDGVLSVIDFKTSNNNKKTDMIEDYFLQTTAYALMWYELTGEPIEDIVIIMAVEKGIVPLIFKDKIDKYVEPLMTRISEYNKRRNR